jgi:hypothetical protein
MSNLSSSLLSLDEPALEVALTPSPPPQSGEHTMRRRSQGLGHPLPNLYTHLHRHVHTNLGEWMEISSYLVQLHLFQNLLGLTPILL